MPNVKEIFEKLNELAPIETKLGFDNVGFLAGFAEREVKKILLALDVTEDVINEAIAENAELIVSHHPMFFSLSRVTDDNYESRRVVKLLANGMSAICMHTNLDAAVGGVNDALAAAAGIAEPQLLKIEGYYENGEPYCIGRYGDLRSEMPFEQYLSMLASVLQTSGIRYHYAGKPVKRVAVVGGSGGGDIVYALEKGCDTFITADIKYDIFLRAKEEGINVIDGDHFATENLIIPPLARYISGAFPEVETIVSKTHKQIIKFFNT